jgi:hypothetical protein
LFASGEPRAARTAGEVKFSAAISCRVLDCRFSSPSSTSAISGSSRIRAAKSCGRSVTWAEEGAAGVVTDI